MSSADDRPKKSLASLWLIAAVCAAPVIASYAVFYFWRPADQVNYGELIGPRPLPAVMLAQVDGSPFEFSRLAGKWVLATADPAACDAYCETKLTYMRQLRLALGKEVERVERVWLITDAAAPDAALAARHPGVWLVRAAGTPLVPWLPATGSVADHIYVIDPLGNLMMRYPRDPDPRRMLKDLSRLLRHSKWK
jgi:cytochrome oxidase Cu insertion factor (SCO1/SenC/PrrC family)